MTRASGRCLDVVRVLRINGGAPAVESVAIRCQAVLEALRGRADAARRMVASARRTAERLGLTHRRPRDRGRRRLHRAPRRRRGGGRGASCGRRTRACASGGSTARPRRRPRSSARALLLQDRVDEADAVAAEAEALAGADLKAGIAWRGVRAECAARRGDGDLALRLAGEAVDLAAATDALLLVADARLALAAVLRAPATTPAPTRRRAEPSRRARRRARPPSPPGPRQRSPARGCSSARDQADRLDRRTGAARERGAGRGDPLPGGVQQRRHGRSSRRTGIWTSGSWTGGSCWRKKREPTRRASPPTSRSPSDPAPASTRPSCWSPVVTSSPSSAGTSTTRLPSGRSSSSCRVADNGQMTNFVMFDADQRNAANVELDQLTPSSLEIDNDAWRTVRRYAAATNAKDMDAVLGVTSPVFERTDHRTGMGAERIADPLDVYRTLFTLDDWAREMSAIELHGDRRVLVRDLLWFRDGAVADAEVASLQIFEIDDAGLLVRQTAFDPQDLEAARAELHADGGSQQESPASRVARQHADAINRHDWDGLTALVSPQAIFLDRRGTVTAPDETGFLEVYGTLFTMDDWAIERTVIEGDGDQSCAGPRPRLVPNGRGPRRRGRDPPSVRRRRGGAHRAHGQLRRRRPRGRPHGAPCRRRPGHRHRRVACAPTLRRCGQRPRLGRVHGMRRPRVGDLRPSPGGHGSGRDRSRRQLPGAVLARRLVDRCSRRSTWPAIGASSLATSPGSATGTPPRARSTASTSSRSMPTSRSPGRCPSMPTTSSGRLTPEPTGQRGWRAPPIGG